MSESPKATQSNKKGLTRYLIVIIAVLVLLLVYGSGTIVLPNSIRSSHANRNCDTTLTLGNFYTVIYPDFMEDETLTDLVMECAIYTLAGRQEADAEWQSALNTYEVYSGTYPNGIFTEEVSEQSALALVNLAKEQAVENNYPQAISNLNIVLTQYGDTGVTDSATELLPELYTAWGAGLRDTGDFEDAQRVFGDFKSWAENNQQIEHSEAAQREIAQTYLNWGLQLQSQKQFEEAESKFESARSSNATLAAQVRANEEKFHIEWGDFLITQKDFDGAMLQYGIASNLVQDSDPVVAKDVIANGYMHWAGELSAQEDFIGALVLLDVAQENAATDSATQSVDEARNNTYLAFSESAGEQAQKVMSDAAALVCRHKTNPRLPIFGIANDPALVGIYGVGGSLPEELAATTPGLLQYVVCIEENINVVGSTKHTLFASAAGFRPYLFERFQYTWTVTMRKTDTGAETATTIIEGGDPPPFPTTDFEIYSAAFNGSTQYFGQKPDFAELVTWISQALK